MFDPFLEELHKRIRGQGGEPIDLPVDLRNYSNNRNTTNIKNWLWNVPGFRRWRVTRLDSGNKLQVLNSVAYPSFNKDQPIMGLDLLWFGIKGKLIAVLDFQPLVQEQLYFEKYYSDLKELKANFPNFNSREKMYSYDPNQFFSPWVLFCEGGTKEAETLLPEVFNLFLDAYFKLDNYLSDNTFKLDSNKVSQLHINYDKYSAERDPAHNLFSTFFGSEWSEMFLKDFLFPLS